MEATTTVEALFDLGQTLATPGALAALEAIGKAPAELLARHVSGDWGDLSEDDKAANGHAVRNGERVFSCYRFGDVKLYAVTEWDRSATTVLLAEEY